MLKDALLKHKCRPRKFSHYFPDKTFNEVAGKARRLCVEQMNLKEPVPIGKQFLLDQRNWTDEEQ